MDACDVLIVGGGPAGSACAWKLRQAGLDVVVMDRAAFPRDKVCAGWITPPIVSELRIDVSEYRRGRTFQPINGFRIGLVGDARETEVRYPEAVSFGIRRCEFDHFLLQRSGARLLLGEPGASFKRDASGWTVNERLRARVIVGAGGHFCPVARLLNDRTDINGRPDHDALVVAQEVEFPVDPQDDATYTTDPELPELFFCQDLKGYGWCFRKGRYVNVGFGRLDPRSLPSGTAAFVRFLEAAAKVPPHREWRWRGHAYLVRNGDARRVVDSGVLLIGDAAGLAYAQSGEGIRPAIESGLLAAATIIEADRSYSTAALQPYARRLQERFGSTGATNVMALIPAAVTQALAARLLKTRAFVRHVVIDRWFLHANQPPLGA